MCVTFDGIPIPTGSYNILLIILLYSLIMNNNVVNKFMKMSIL